MTRTRGILLAFTRCNRAAQLADWETWYDEVHLPDLVRESGPWIATRWRLPDPPAPGRPSLGFTHVALYELDDPDLRACARRLFARDRALRRRGRVHPAHCVLGAELLQAHGRFCEKAAPSAELRGHILAWVMCSQPGRESEWDAWYESQHAPDMLASGAFRALTRWRRHRRSAHGPQHLTLYDVAGHPVSEAVERSFAAMPRIHAAGRWLDCHAGGMAFALEPSGRHGAAGYRRPSG